MMNLLNGMVKNTEDGGDVTIAIPLEPLLREETMKRATGMRMRTNA
jgi:hypothetical protein